METLVKIDEKNNIGYGYVLIPKNHLLYGVDYNHINDLLPDLNVNLTFSKVEETNKNIWKVGFFYYYFYGRDIEKLKKEIETLKNHLVGYSGKLKQNDELLPLKFGNRIFILSFDTKEFAYTDIFCNLENIHHYVKIYGRKNIKKVQHFWDGKAKKLSIKEVNEMLESHRLDLL